LLTEEETDQMKTGVKGFLSLRGDVSSKWAGHSTVLEESRMPRRHETT